MKRILHKPVLIEAITAVFIFLFAYTGLDKLLDRANFEVTLLQSPLLGSFAALISWVVPLTELAICLLLLWPKTKLAGLYASFFLMLLFTIYITYMIIRGGRMPCHCGGIISQLNWSQHLTLNVLLTIAAFGAIRHLKSKSSGQNNKVTLQGAV